MGKNKKKSGREKDNHFHSDGADNDLKTHEEKPLPKLVLKVGKEKKIKSEIAERNGPETGHEAGHETGHLHHKKKKKKHKHKTEEVLEKKSRKREATEVSESEQPVKRTPRTAKDKDKKKEVKEPEVSPFTLCLETLIRNLQRKDVYGIFTYPVTDLIAPGYSKIIKNPMDFNTMSKKIDSGQYSNIEHFKQDYVLMCNNAMLYNGPDTIYYKSAEKMLGIGIKMLSKDKMKKINKSIGLPYSDSEDDVVLVDDTDYQVDTIYNHGVKKRTPDKKRKDTKYESLVTSSILAAARDARRKLVKKYPSQKYGYLSKDSQGNTSFNILNPDTTEENKSAPANLGELAGKLKTGIPAGQIVFKDEKKTKSVPVQYLVYGPYGSFGPTYDSSLSNLSKEDSDLLLCTYGTEAGVTYAKSVLEFTKDAPLARGFIDNLLDAITGGAHSKLTLSQKKSDVNTKSATTVKVASNDKHKVLEDSAVDINSLLTLNGLGIDVSFLKHMAAISPSKKEGPVVSAEEKLKENTALLQDLQNTQNKRFSSKPGNQTIVPDEEIKIAMNVTNNLKDLIKMVRPKDVVSAEGIRTAIGCNLPQNVPQQKEPENNNPNKSTNHIKNVDAAMQDKPEKKEVLDLTFDEEDMKENSS